jgi:hypothetical protein
VSSSSRPLRGWAEGQAKTVSRRNFRAVDGHHACTAGPKMLGPTNVQLGSGRSVVPAIARAKGVSMWSDRKSCQPQNGGVQPVVDRAWRLPTATDRGGVMPPFWLVKL